MLGSLGMPGRLKRSAPRHGARIARTSPPASNGGSQPTAQPDRRPGNRGRRPRQTARPRATAAPGRPGKLRVRRARRSAWPGGPGSSREPQPNRRPWDQSAQQTAGQPDRLNRGQPPSGARPMPARAGAGANLALRKAQDPGGADPRPAKPRQREASPGRRGATGPRPIRADVRRPTRAGSRQGREARDAGRDLDLTAAAPRHAPRTLALAPRRAPRGAAVAARSRRRAIAEDGRSPRCAGTGKDRSHRPSAGNGSVAVR